MHTSYELQCSSIPSFLLLHTTPTPKQVTSLTAWCWCGTLIYPTVLSLSSSIRLEFPMLALCVFLVSLVLCKLPAYTRTLMDLLSMYCSLPSCQHALRVTTRTWCLVDRTRARSSSGTTEPSVPQCSAPRSRVSLVFFEFIRVSYVCCDVAKSHTHPVYCVEMIGTQNAHNIITVSTDGKLCNWNLDMLKEPIEVSFSVLML